MVPTFENGSDLGSDLEKKGRNPNFGRRLKEKRVAKGLTQKELAQILGINKYTLQRYEAGEPVNSNLLLLMADLFGCSVDWLLKGREHYTVLPNSRPAEKTVLQHFDIIQQFSDTESAKSANMDLLIIERTNHAAFKEVVAYIKGVSIGLRAGLQNIQEELERKTG